MAWRLRAAYGALAELHCSVINACCASMYLVVTTCRNRLHKTPGAYQFLFRFFPLHCKTPPALSTSAW